MGGETVKSLVSMGIYMFSPEALKNLPKDKFFNVPESNSSST